MLLLDNPVDYRTACVKGAAVVLDSRRFDETSWWFKRSKMLWSVSPTVAGAHRDDKRWLPSIGYERFPDPPHLMFHHLTKGALAYFLFNNPAAKDMPAHCFGRYRDLSKLSQMTFSKLERMAANQIPGGWSFDQVDWDNVSLYMRTDRILKEAQTGDFREPQDLFRFGW